MPKKITVGTLSRAFRGGASSGFLMWKQCSGSHCRLYRKGRSKSACSEFLGLFGRPLALIANCDIVISICNMKLSEKIRYLREVEGNLRGLGRAMTQQEVVRAIQESN